MEDDLIGMKEVIARLPMPIPKHCVYTMASVGLFPPIEIKPRGREGTKWKRVHFEKYLELLKDEASHDEIILFLESVTNLSGDL